MGIMIHVKSKHQDKWQRWFYICRGKGQHDQVSVLIEMISRRKTDFVHRLTYLGTTPELQSVFNPRMALFNSFSKL